MFYWTLVVKRFAEPEGKALTQVTEMRCLHTLCVGSSLESSDLQEEFWVKKGAGYVRLPDGSLSRLVYFLCISHCKIPRIYEWTHWASNLRRNSMHIRQGGDPRGGPWTYWRDYINWQAPNFAAATVIQTWLMGWKLMYYKWTGTKASVNLTVSSAQYCCVSLEKTVKPWSHLVCYRIWKTWFFFQYVMNLASLGWFSPGLYPSSVHKQTPHNPPP